MHQKMDVKSCHNGFRVGGGAKDEAPGSPPAQERQGITKN